MKVVAPRIVTDAILTATNLVETDNVPYSSANTYAKGARVRRASSFDFTGGTLPAGATLARASTGTYTASNGLLATAAINVARFDFNAATGAIKGLMVEPQRTNIVLQSIDLTASSWELAGAITRTGGVPSPDGTSYGSRFVISGNQSVFQRFNPVSASTTYALSCYAIGSGSNPATNLRLTTNNGASASTGMSARVSLTSAYRQVSVTGLLSNTTGAAIKIGSSDRDDAYDSAVSGSFDLAFGQLELVPAGQFAGPTSFISTTTAAATRAADVLTLNWASRGATDGNYTVRYTFDDGSTQDLPATVSGGVATVPTASLNRTIIARAQLTSLIDGVRIYESLQANNVGHALTDAAWWIDAGPTNRWAMFDGAVGSLSRATGSISVTLKPDVAIDALAVLEVNAASVRVQISAAGASIYDQTKVAGVAPASLTFFGLPAAANATVTVTIAGATGATPVSAGALLIGNLADLGLTEAGPSIGINDFSKRQTDDFGVTSVVERGWAKRMSIRSKIDTSAVADLQQRLTTLRALPSLWIGEEGFDSLVIYGFFKEFAVDLALDTISFCTLTIEGMTTASDLDRDTPAGYDALQAQVTNALDRIAVIQSDGYLSAGEKPDIIRQATDIANEYADIVAKAVTLGVSSVAYANAYSTLNAYLSGLTPAYTDTTADTAVVASTFNSKFADYYLARTALLNAVTAKAATMANWSSVADPTGKKPADNATRNDDSGNLLRSPITLDLMTFGPPTTLEVIPNAAGRTADKYRVVLSGPSFSTANWQGDIFVPCSANELMYYRHAVKADVAGADTLQAVAAFLRTDGSVISYATFATSSASSVAGTGFTIREGRFTTPADCSQFRLYIERSVNNGASAFRVGEPYLSRSQPGADITAEAQIVVGELPEILIPASSTGVIASGVLPISVPVKVTRGGVDIHADASTTYALANAGAAISGSNGTVTIDNSNTADKGTLTLSAASGSGSVDVIVTVGGVAQYPAKKQVYTIQRAAAPAAPPTGGGTGGGAGSSTAGNVDNKSISSTTLSQAIIFSGLVVPSSKTVTANLSCDYFINGNTPGNSSLLGKFQYAPTSTTTWTDMGSTVQGTPSSIPFKNDSADPGHLDVAQAASPAAGTYDVRFVWATTNSARTVYTTEGPVSVAISA